MAMRIYCLVFHRVSRPLETGGSQWRPPEQQKHRCELYWSEQEGPVREATHHGERPDTQKQNLVGQFCYKYKELIDFFTDLIILYCGERICTVDKLLYCRKTILYCRQIFVLHKDDFVL